MCFCSSKCCNVWVLELEEIRTFLHVEISIFLAYIAEANSNAIAVDIVAVMSVLSMPEIYLTMVLCLIVFSLEGVAGGGVLVVVLIDVWYILISEGVAS